MMYAEEMQDTMEYVDRMEESNQEYVEEVIAEAGVRGFFDHNCPDFETQGELLSHIIGLFFLYEEKDRGYEILDTCRIRGLICL